MRSEMEGKERPRRGQAREEKGDDRFWQMRRRETFYDLLERAVMKTGHLLHIPPINRVIKFVICVLLQNRTWQ